MATPPPLTDDARRAALAKAAEARRVRANLKQAMLPDNAEMNDNPLGSAPGIRLQIGDCLVLCTPGVPSEMKAMFKKELQPILLDAFPDTRQQVIRRMQVFGIGESTLQQ